MKKIGLTIIACSFLLAACDKEAKEVKEGTDTNETKTVVTKEENPTAEQSQTNTNETTPLTEQSESEKQETNQTATKEQVSPVLDEKTTSSSSKETPVTKPTQTQVSAKPATTTSSVGNKAVSSTYPLSSNEAEMFMRVYVDFYEYSYSIETGKNEYATMITSDKERKTLELSKDGSKFYAILTNGKTETYDVTNGKETIEAHRKLVDFFKNSPELKVTFEMIENKLVTFHVAEYVKGPSGGTHTATMDWVTYDINTGTFKGQFADYTSLNKK